MPQKNYEAYVEAGVNQHFKLVALDDQQVAEYKEKGEIHGEGINDYLATKIDEKDLYSWR